MTEDWTSRPFIDVPAGATPAPGTESIDAEFLNAIQVSLQAKLNVAEGDARYLQLAGGTLTGGLAVGANSLQPNADNVFGSTTVHAAIFKTNNVERARFDSTGLLTFPSAAAGRLRIHTDGKIHYDSHNAFSNTPGHTWYAVQRYTSSRTSKEAVIAAQFDTAGAGSVQDGHQGIYAQAADRTNVANRAITNIVSGTGSVMRLTVTAHGFLASEKVHVYGITGTGNVSALNGNYFSITVVDANTIELVGTTFGGTYTSGGTASNRGLFYGMAIALYPRQSRGGLTGNSRFGDDVAGLTISQTGETPEGAVSKATDGIYLSTRGSTVLPTRLTVTGGTLNGALVRLTVTAHGLVTGEQVNVYGVVGMTAANGTWTITSVDANTVELQGSSGTGQTYTSGGIVANLSRPEWGTIFTSDAAAEFGIRLNGNHRNYGLDLKDGVFGIGQIRLKNDNYVIGRAANDFGDFPIFKFNILNELQVDVVSRWNNTLTIGSGVNLSFSTGTGTKIGTGTTQKIGFFNATPIVQPANTTDLRQAMIDLGLLATGGATPLNLNGGTLRAAGVEHDTSGTYTSRDAILTFNRAHTTALTGPDHSGVDIRITGRHAGTVSDRFNGVKIVVGDDGTVGQHSITGATNASPIVVTTSTSHAFVDGTRVWVQGVLGNTNANGLHYIDVLSSTTFALYSNAGLSTPIAGNAAYTSGGIVTNKTMNYGVASIVYPLASRGNLTGAAQYGDDMAAYVANNTQGNTYKATDAYYLAQSSTSKFNVTTPGAVNNGSGLVRLTVTGHNLVTGDQVRVTNVQGVTAAWGKWTVTVIDANTIDLQGSTFAGTWTSGGQVANLSKSEWITQFTADSAADYGIRLNGTINQFGLDFKDGMFGLGQIRLKNDSYVMGRGATDVGDVNIFKLNVLNEFQVDSLSRFNNHIAITSGVNFIFGTSGSGTKFGTATNNKIGFFNATPIVQPAGHAAATGTATRTTFATGTVTLPQLAEQVKALKDDLLSLGLIGA